VTDFLPLPPPRPPNLPFGKGPLGKAPLGKAPLGKAPVSKGPVSKGPVSKDMEIRLVAQKLEATFIAEMLKSAGFGEQENSFSGSAGEDQFASFQRNALAEQIVKVGGIGLAEAFYKSMTETK